MTATDATNVKTTKKRAGAPKAADRVTPEFTTVRTDIPVPATARVGRKSEFAIKLAALEVGGTFGLANKTKAQISTAISKANNDKANLIQRKNEDGTPVMKNGDPIKDANGAIVGYSQVPDMVKVKEFVAHDVNPKTDPDKATVRIWRTK